MQSSNAVIFVEINGKLHAIRRMEVHENVHPIIGQPGHSAHRLVLKLKKHRVLSYLISFKRTINNTGSLETRAKFYEKIKRKFKTFSLIRLENNSLHGTPDLLVCNNSGHFFTIELKVCKGNKIRFSPHQISFHTRHPHNTFIMVEALGPGTVKLFRGSRIMELVSLWLEA